MNNEHQTYPADNEQNDIIMEMILAIGYRIRGVRGVQFRQWATLHLSEYLVKGFTMDDERLKNPDGRPDYFDELLQRADVTLPNMGLMTWKGSVVRKGDVIIAKNYLVKDEIDKLNRLVMLFLESAELRVKERKDLTLDYWRSNVDALLTLVDYQCYTL